MIDLLNQEIMKEQHGLCVNERFMKAFKKHSESKESIFGLALADFDAEEIEKIDRPKNFPRYV